VSALPADVVRLSHYLQPGQLYVSRTPVVLTTILGSCISVCLWDDREGVGGMNHFMLPHYAGSGVQSARFGNVAMQELLDKIVDAGGRKRFLRARVFGGACMFQQMKSAAHLGSKNAELALDFLSRHGIEVVQIDVGGDHGRKIRFNTDEGTVCLSSI